MIMSTVGRGGEGDVGQRIRDEILVIQVCILILSDSVLSHSSLSCLKGIIQLKSNLNYRAKMIAREE